MHSFGELLTEYMRRTGISDSELARTLGVSRQTIFRWKEGVTTRPRVREDVLRCADRLRLSGQERDELLVAAGFAPEAPLIASTIPSQMPGRASYTEEAPRNDAPLDGAPLPLRGTPQAEAAAPAAIGGTLPARVGRIRRRFWPVAMAAAFILLLLFLRVVRPDLYGIVSQPGEGVVPAARAGETLILLAPFTAITTGQPGYDVTARILTALERESRAARRDDVRLERLDTDVRDMNRAADLGQTSRAALVIWGNQNNGIAAARIVLPSRRQTISSPLSSLVRLPERPAFTVDSGSTEELRVLALATLAEIDLAKGQTEPARGFLTQALARPPPAHDAAGAVYLLLGYSYQVDPNPDLERAVAFYNQAVDLAPEMSEAYLNRGIANLRLGRSQEWQEDIKQALVRAPTDVTAPRALCWGYALEHQPSLALPYCDTAVSIDQTGMSRDARGVVEAELGKNEQAAADFQGFLDWLAQFPPTIRDRYTPSRSGWIVTLQKGQNPIDAAALDRIRSE